MPFPTTLIRAFWAGAFLVFVVSTSAGSAVYEEEGAVTIRSGSLRMTIQKAGFRFRFRSADGRVDVKPHPTSGLRFGPAEKLQDSEVAEYLGENGGAHEFRVVSRNGLQAKVAIRLDERRAHLSAFPVAPTRMAFVFRVAGASPGFGLGDHHVFRICPRKHSEIEPGLGTDVTGFVDDNMYSGSAHRTRMVSNFVIYPKHRFAVVNIDPQPKIVRSTAEEVAQGSRCTDGLTDLYFYFGSPREIYQQYLTVRREAGYAVPTPKYDFFGVGWEAFGALGWRTSATTVEQDVDKYLNLGIPLRWIVVGSGFWDSTHERMLSTTSFGKWNRELFPSPEEFVDRFRRKGLKVVIGLRIAFIRDGLFSAEGLRREFFMQEDGAAKLYQLAFPRRPVYLLDTSNEDAVSWYAELCDRWGVDGFKEDLFGFESYVLIDNKLNPVNDRLMREGYYVMGRNAYLASPSDLHRFEDFNYDQDQDRGPINALTCAYSGFPFVYPDIVGGQFGGKQFDGEISPRIRQYMKRCAWFAALHPGMSVGKGPWHFDDPSVVNAVRDATQLHDRLHPFIYSQVVRSCHDGFPWPLAPLPLVFPDDPMVYGRENSAVRGYQWMIGDALLATPLYGNDYHTANSRDVYLPAGKWIEYDSGFMHEGPKLIRDYPLPVGKTPLFVGGTGVVVENVDRQLRCRVYPLTQSVDVTFWDADGKDRSRIRVRDPSKETPVVVDMTTGERLKVEWKRHAIEFVIRPKHDYAIGKRPTD